jgi:hypothetical protein
MCDQTVGLVSGELERRGIATVAVQLLRLVAEAVAPPRALLVPFPHGYPLGEPDRPEIQHAVLAAALRLLEDTSLVPPALVELPGHGADEEDAAPPGEES